MTTSSGSFDEQEEPDYLSPRSLAQLVVQRVPEPAVLLTRSNFELVKCCGTFEEVLAKLHHGGSTLPSRPPHDDHQVTLDGRREEGATPAATGGRGQAPPVDKNVEMTDDAISAGFAEESEGSPLLSAGAFVVQHPHFTHLTNAIDALPELARRFAQTPTYELSEEFLRQIESALRTKRSLVRKLCRFFGYTQLCDAVERCVNKDVPDFEKIPLVVTAMNAGGYEVFRANQVVDLHCLSRTGVMERAELALFRARQEFLLEQLVSLQEHLGIAPIEKSGLVTCEKLATMSVVSRDGGAGAAKEARLSFTMDLLRDLKSHDPERKAWDLPNPDSAKHAPFGMLSGLAQRIFPGYDGEGGRLFKRNDPRRSWLEGEDCLQVRIRCSPFGAIDEDEPFDARNFEVFDLLRQQPPQLDVEKQYRAFLDKYRPSNKTERVAFEAQINRIAHLQTKETQTEITNLTLRRCPKFENVLGVLEAGSNPLKGDDLAWMLEMGAEGREIFEHSTDGIFEHSTVWEQDGIFEQDGKFLSILDHLDFVTSEAYREYHEIGGGAADAVRQPLEIHLRVSNTSTATTPPSRFRCFPSRS